MSLIFISCFRERAIMEGLYGDEWEEHLKHENMPREDYQVIGNSFLFFQIYKDSKEEKQTKMSLFFRWR